jgi:hypothetical protein
MGIEEDILAAVICGVMIFLFLKQSGVGCGCNKERFGHRRPLISNQTWEDTTLADMDDFDKTYGNRAGYWGQPAAGGGWNTPNLRKSESRIANTNLASASKDELRDIMNSAIMDFR